MKAQVVPDAQCLSGKLCLIALIRGRKLGIVGRTSRWLAGKCPPIHPDLNTAISNGGQRL